MSFQKEDFPASPKISLKFAAFKWMHDRMPALFYIRLAYFGCRRRTPVALTLLDVSFLQTISSQSFIAVDISLAIGSINES
jgi:hypothetical protein